MSTGYTRNYFKVDGNSILAEDFNTEFQLIDDAFDKTSGHKHDGSVDGGGFISLISDSNNYNSVEFDLANNEIDFNINVSNVKTLQVSVTDGAIVPNVDNDIDLGTASKEFKNLYIDGIANIDSLIADTADINGGTIDAAVIGATTPAAGSFTTVAASTSVSTAALTASSSFVLSGSTALVAIDTDISSVSANHDTLATAKAIKAYVDSSVTGGVGGVALDVAGDSGTVEINLGSETLTIAGGTGLTSVGSGNTVTINIDSTVATLTGTQTLTNKTLTAPVISTVGSSIVPTADNTYDLGSSTAEWKDLYVDGVAYVDSINLNGTTLTATGTELNVLDGVSPTLTAAELSILDGVTVTATEINYLSGVTSNVQDQLDAIIVSSDGYNNVTPTAVSNVSSVASGKIHYLRVGEVVTGSGYVVATASSIGVIASIDIPTPVNSNFTNSEQASGCGTVVFDWVPVIVVSGSAANKLRIQWKTASTGARTIQFSFSYVVIP